MHPIDTDSIKKAAHRAQVLDGRLKPPPWLSPRIWRVAEYLDHSFARPITLREAATVVDLHPDYLSRRFKFEMGVGFHEYLLTVRLQRATTLLVASTKSIKEIGYDVGFRAPEVFSKAFKRLMGCAPTTYRIHNLPFYGGLKEPASVGTLTNPRVASAMCGPARSDLFEQLADCCDER